MAWPPLHCVPSSQVTDANRAGGDRRVPGEEALPGAKQKGLHDSCHLKAVAAFELEVGSKRGGESPGALEPLGTPGPQSRGLACPAALGRPASGCLTM